MTRRSPQDYVPANPVSYALMEAAVNALLDEGRRVIGKRHRTAAMRRCILFTIQGLLAHNTIHTDPETITRAAETITFLKQRLQELAE